MTLSSRDEAGWRRRFLVTEPGAEAMGSQEVLGQAARLASSGLLLQVLSAPPPQAVPQPGFAGARLPAGSVPV